MNNSKSLEDIYFCNTEVKSDFNKFIVLKDEKLDMLKKYSIFYRIIRSLKTLNGTAYYHVAVNHDDYQKSLR